MTTLTELFSTFQSRGEKTAFVYRTGIRRFTYSYQWLHDQSLRMASWLEQQGVGKGDRVVIWAPNSPWWGVAFWGCVVRGAIVVPVDFMSGKDRAEKIVKLTEAKVVLQSQFKIDRITNNESRITNHNSPQPASPELQRGEPSLTLREGVTHNPPLKIRGDRGVMNIENLEYLLPDLPTNHSPRFGEADYPLATSSEDTAELIYTSGTTGDPKGVILTHKNLISNMEQINQHVPVVSEKWNFLSVLPLSHTFEQMAGFLTPLYRGGTIVYMRTLKPSAIMEALEHEDIYAFPIVPRLLQALKLPIERELEAKHLSGIFRWLLKLNSPQPASPELQRGEPSLTLREGEKNLPPLKVRGGEGGVMNIQKRKKWFFPIHHKFGRHFQFFISGGAALPRETAEFWMGMGFRVIEGYGITECSPVLTANTFDEQIIGSTGKPLPGVEIKIGEHNSPQPSLTLREGEEDVPPLKIRGGVGGVMIPRIEGEILAKGPNVFPGYYQNEEATKKAFTNDGFFKTGDNGYFDAQGNLYIKGRQKEMIVTGAGINVYPDDIEPILSAIPGVKEACVIGKNTPEGEEVHAVLMLTEEHNSPPASTREDTSTRGGQPSLTLREGEEDVPPLKIRGGVGGVMNPEERAKQIIDIANAKLDTLQQITSFTIWPEKEFPKTSTMKVQKFKVKEMVQMLERENVTTSSQTDKLISIIATVTGKSSNEITEQSILVSDLGLTSIARLELVNTLEQEFRLDMEDTSITQATSVADLRKMIEKREKRKGDGAPRAWTDTIPVKVVRFVVDYLIHIPLLKTIISLEKKGLENLKDIKGPVIFIANHISYLDPYVILWSLPIRFRYRIAPAAGDFLFFNKKSIIGAVVGRLMYTYASFFSMALLVGERYAFRTTLQHMGKLIDRNTHIFIFPEGERAWDGKLLPFQPGIGIMAKELKVPVVPIKLTGLFEIWPRGKFIQRRGRASIIFGKPMKFANESTEEILHKTRQAIAEL